MLSDKPMFSDANTLHDYFLNVWPNKVQLIKILYRENFSSELKVIFKTSFRVCGL